MCRALLLPLGQVFLLLCSSPSAVSLRAISRPSHASLICHPEEQRPAAAAGQLVRAEPRQCQQRQPEAASCEFINGPSSFLRKFGSFWQSKRCPLTPASIANATRPQGFEGSRLRLREVAAKLNAGQKVNITVLGPSMTKGTQSYRAWPLRLGDLFEKAGIAVKIKNLARGGSTTRWAVGAFHDLKTTLQDADVILTDYGLNDREPAFAEDHDHVNGAEGVKMAHHNLMELLISLPQRPAVIDIQTFVDTPLILAQSNSEVSVPTNNCGSVDVTKYNHWSVNQELGIPMVSYIHAVCHTNRTYWMMEYKDGDSEGSPHPGAITHDLLARVVLGLFLGEMDKVCLEGVSGAEHPNRRQELLDSQVKCLTQPTTAYDAQYGNSAMVPLSYERENWRFGEDVPGKPGWITEAPTQLYVKHGGDISFQVETRGGWLQFEYLGTYEKIGHVTVWLDDAEPTASNSCDMNGFWADYTSQSKFSLFKTVLPPGNHTVKIRSYGKKFKLLGITAC